MMKNISSDPNFGSGFVSGTVSSSIRGSIMSSLKSSYFDQSLADCARPRLELVIFGYLGQYPRTRCTNSAMSGVTYRRPRIVSGIDIGPRGICF